MRVVPAAVLAQPTSATSNLDEAKGGTRPLGSPKSRAPLNTTDGPPTSGSTKSPAPPRQTIVLDTSVLVADPSAIHGYGGGDIVIPLTVIEELDAHKTRRDDVGQAAREALRTLEVLRIAHKGDIRTAVELPNGGTVRVETNGVHLDQIRAVGLDVREDDDGRAQLDAGERWTS